jgi:hypothetical protein
LINAVTDGRKCDIGRIPLKDIYPERIKLESLSGGINPFNRLWKEILTKEK